MLVRIKNVTPLQGFFGGPRVGFHQNIFCEPQKAVWAMAAHWLMHCSFWPEEGLSLVLLTHPHVAPEEDGKVHPWRVTCECPSPEARAH